MKVALPGEVLCPLLFTAPRLFRREREHTPQEISPELFINTAVPPGFDFSGEHAFPAAAMALPAGPAPAVPQTPAQTVPVPFQVPDPRVAALYGAGIGGVTGAGLGLLIDSSLSGAVGGALLGAGVGGTAAPFISPYLVAKLNEVYGRR